MCGIFAALNKADLLKLATANAYRGQHSFSITGFNLTKEKRTTNPKLGEVIRRIGKFSLDGIPDYDFYVGHIQAPTSGASKDLSTVHPAQIEKHRPALLWHNGIIKEHECNRLRDKQRIDEQWDTMLLLREVEFSGQCIDNLSEINGSFACVAFLWDNIYVFRNAIAPMFMGEGCLSSVRTDLTPVNVKAERFYLIDFNHDVSKLHLNEVGRFQTKENPYVGLEEDDE